MKKLLSIFFSAVVFTSSIFAGFFSNRIFEVVIDAPVSVTNNSVAIMDFFQETVNIDLNDFAKQMPKKGFQVTAWTDPSVAVNLDVKVLQMGIKAGVDVFTQMGVSKDIFDFLCNGNEIGESVDVKGNLVFDSFAFIEADLGFKVKKFGVSLIPAVFAPIIHISADDIGASILNDEDGNVIFDLDGTAKLHSVANLNTPDEILAKAFSSVGFDLAGQVSYAPVKLLNLTGYMRMPIVPGRLSYASSKDLSMHYETNINLLMSGEASENNTDFAMNGDDFVKEEYLINRPFKMNVRADYQLLPKLFTVSAGTGFGIRNPFNEEEATFFPEYYLAAKLSFFDMLRLTVSSEYTNCLYIQQFAATTSLRFFQLDVGTSLQSSSFANSFKLSGLGAFVTVSIGF